MNTKIEKVLARNVRSLIRAGYSEKMARAIAKYPAQKFRDASRFGNARAKELRS